MRIIRSVRRALMALFVIAAFAAGAVEAVHAEGGTCKRPVCDCCLTVDCPGRCWHVCPDDHHECGNHHPGTECDWDDIE